jgi:hypothetical protein
MANLPSARRVLPEPIFGDARHAPIKLCLGSSDHPSSGLRFCAPLPRIGAHSPGVSNPLATVTKNPDFEFCAVEIQNSARMPCPPLRARWVSQIFARGSSQPAPKTRRRSGRGGQNGCAKHTRHLPRAITPVPWRARFVTAMITVRHGS